MSRSGTGEAGTGEAGGETTPVDVIPDVDRGRLGRLAFSGVIWSAARQGMSRIVSVVIFTLLARTLAPEHFGLVAVASVVIGFIEAPLSVSLGDALIQRPRLRRIELDSAFWALTVASAVLAGAVALASPLVALAFDAPEVTPLVAVLGCSVLFTGLSVTPEALLRRQMKYRQLTTRKVLADAVSGALGVALAFAGAGAWALVVKLLTYSILMTGMAFAATRWLPALRMSWVALRELASFGMWSITNSLVGYATRHVDDIVIGAVLGSVALGYYVVAYQLLVIAILLASETIDSVALSVFARVDGDPDRIGRGASLALRGNTVIVVGVSTMVIAFAPSIIVLAFGEQWAPSVPVVRILILATVAAPTTSIVVAVMKAVGRPDLAVKLALPRVAILTVLMVAMARFGLEWVAASRILLFVLFIPVNLVLLGRLCRMTWRPIGWMAARVVSVGLAAGALGVGLVGSWNEPSDSFLRLVLAGVAAGLLYVAGVALVARSDIEEVLGFIRRRKLGV